MRFLIVDDDFDARRLMLRYLSSYGNCDAAANGNEAIQAFRKAVDEKEPYDLICMDVMMPNVNGHGALKAIRQIESEQGLQGVKVIMTTALGDCKNLMGTFKKLGCESYVVKPVKKDNLFQEIEKLGLTILTQKC
jgi:two-component system, chemotaxis family, chemotaxis protein CheY